MTFELLKMSLSAKNACVSLMKFLFCLLFLFFVPPFPFSKCLQNALLFIEFAIRCFLRTKFELFYFITLILQILTLSYLVCILDNSILVWKAYSGCSRWAHCVTCKYIPTLWFAHWSPVASFARCYILKTWVYILLV